jgi:hypothetical protein
MKSGLWSFAVGDLLRRVRHMRLFCSLRMLHICCPRKVCLVNECRNVGLGSTSVEIVQRRFNTYVDLVVVVTCLSALLLCVNESLLYVVVG